MELRRQDVEAQRLAEIERRLHQLSRAEQASALGGLDGTRERLAEVIGLLEESKRLARDGHTGIFARIAILAGFLEGRLTMAVRRAERGRSS